MMDNSMMQGLLSQLLMSKLGMQLGGQPGQSGQPGQQNQFGNLGLLSQQNPNNLLSQLQMNNPTAGQQTSAPLPAPSVAHAPFPYTPPSTMPNFPFNIQAH